MRIQILIRVCVFCLNMLNVSLYVDVSCNHDPYKCQSVWRPPFQIVLWLGMGTGVWVGGEQVGVLGKIVDLLRWYARWYARVTVGLHRKIEGMLQNKCLKGKWRKF